MLSFDAMRNSFDHDSNPAAYSVHRVVSPLRMSPRALAKKHHVVPISSIAGWKGRRQQLCRGCKQLCGHCCLECSSERGILPLHPPVVCYAGKQERYDCAKMHATDPHHESYTLCVHSSARQKLPLTTPAEPCSDQRAAPLASSSSVARPAPRKRARVSS